MRIDTIENHSKIVKLLEKHGWDVQSSSVNERKNPENNKVENVTIDLTVEINYTDTKNKHQIK